MIVAVSVLANSSSSSVRTDATANIQDAVGVSVEQVALSIAGNPPLQIMLTGAAELVIGDSGRVVSIGRGQLGAERARSHFRAIGTGPSFVVAQFN